MWLPICLEGRFAGKLQVSPVLWTELQRAAGQPRGTMVEAPLEGEAAGGSVSPSSISGGLVETTFAERCCHHPAATLYHPAATAYLIQHCINQINVSTANDSQCSLDAAALCCSSKQSHNTFPP